jgi:AAA+ superfamily predicted ATPase
VTFVATTNYPQGVDVAFLSRADLVEDVGLPDAEAVAAILADTVRELTGRDGLDPAGLAAVATAAAERGTDARQVRKLVLRAICADRALALDPASITLEHIRAAQGAEPDRL